jgi:hypothetical protein
MVKVCQSLKTFTWGGKKRARDSGVSLEEVPDEQLQAQLKRIQEEMERRVAASASADEDDSDA